MILLDVLPAASVVAMFVGLSYRAGQIVQKLNHNIEGVKDLQTDMREVKTDIKRIDAELKDLDKHVAVLDSRLTDMDRRITKA